MAAKRHHASKKSHSVGGYHSLAHERYNHEPMSDYRHAEAVRDHKDRSMISEDPRAIANLPQEVMIKAYPVMPGYAPEGLDDTLRGVDHQMAGDHASMQRGLKPMKF